MRERIARSKAYHVPAIILTALIVANVIQFTYIDSNLPTEWQAIERRDGIDPLKLAGGVERRFELYVALYEYAPGVKLIVPPHKPPSPARLDSFSQHIHGIGKISGMEIKNYDIETFLADFDYTKYLITNFEQHGIAAIDSNVEEMILLYRDGDRILLDTRLIPKEYMEELGA